MGLGGFGMIEKAASWALILLTAGSVLGAEQVVPVNDDASLRTALREAKPGTTIRIASGQYQPGIYAQLKGTQQHPIVIEGADEENPPRFVWCRWTSGCPAYEATTRDRPPDSRLRLK
jgi:hypothetical protein